jgi:membrane-associated phospholipid phosphatase
MKSLALSLALLFMAHAASAQVGTEPLAWAPDNRPTADAISTIGVIGQSSASAISAYKAWKAGDHRPMWRTLCSGGLGGGTAFVLKSLIREERPNGVDDHSFPSGHSAVAAALSGWNFTVGVPLAALVGILRVNANWHHLYKDVMPGWAIGAGAQVACSALIR